MAKHHLITFINKSPLPIIIEAWQTSTYGLSELQEEVVKSGQQITLKSEDGEWTLQTFLEKKLSEEWIKAKYFPGKIIGKIRDKPIEGNYISLLAFENDFKIIYNNEKQIATFSKKKSKKLK
jgi:hypothetical protein